MSTPGGDSNQDPNDQADALERKADAIRENLDGLVAELDHRRHDVVRRWVRPIAIGAAVVGVGVIALVVWWRYRHRPTRLERLGVALRRAMAHPNRVAKTTPSFTKKIATAAGTAGASIAARRLVSRALPGR